MFFTEKNTWDLFLIRFLNYLYSHLIKKFLLAHTRIPFFLLLFYRRFWLVSKEELSTLLTITNSHSELPYCYEYCYHHLKILDITLNSLRG